MEPAMPGWEPVPNAFDTKEQQNESIGVTL